MRRELDNALCTKYPEIFRDRYESPQNTAMCWGFECGDGWYALIDCLCAELMRVSNGTSIPRAMQVKEKFGGLRFYAAPFTEYQGALIDFAEAMSERICEECGVTRTAHRRGEGYVRTLCDTCAQTNDDNQ